MSSIPFRPTRPDARGRGSGRRRECRRPDRCGSPSRWPQRRLRAGVGAGHRRRTRPGDSEFTRRLGADIRQGLRRIGVPAGVDTRRCASLQPRRHSGTIDGSMQRSPLSAGFSDVLGCSRKGKWWLRVPLKFAAKRLFPLSFHRIVNPGYPHFYHFFVAADPGLLRTPTATTAKGRRTGLGGSASATARSSTASK